MSQLLVPSPGSWYVNRTGKLIKVMMVVYDKVGPVSVLLEYRDGQTQLINIASWYCLDLIVHAHIPSPSYAEDNGF